MSTWTVISKTTYGLVITKTYYKDDNAANFHFLVFYIIIKKGES